MANKEAKALPNQRPKRPHLQERGHACCLVLHVWLTALSKVEKTVVVAAVRLCMSQKKGEAGYGGKWFNKATTTGETGKTNCCTLLKQIINIKMSLQKPGQSTFSHLGFPQMGPWHHVGATMENTLDKTWIVIAIHWELNP